jgi:predicted NUDIX family NTP pyrophosphohydrolase
MKKSCGFLIECQNKFLLCHSTKPSGSISLNDGQWGIPKGGCEEGETDLAAALREVEEETIAIISTNCSMFGILVKKVKNTYLFAIKRNY